jgi:predicted DNA-binding protein (UPF0251 family)
VVSPPVLKGFKPVGISRSDQKTVTLLLEEYEALRLADYSGMKQEDAAKMMNVSRPTFTRIYKSCLQKLARAFTEGKSILIEGGDVEFDREWYRCHDCTTVFHQPDPENSGCASCDSDNIEHINQSIRNWKREKADATATAELKEYCICPRCGYEIEHQPGIPCFSMICPECRRTLIRKDHLK